MSLRVYFDAARRAGTADLPWLPFGLAVAIFEGNSPWDSLPHRGELALADTLRAAKHEALELAIRKADELLKTHRNGAHANVVFLTTDRRLVEDVRGKRRPKEAEDCELMQKIRFEINAHKGAWKLKHVEHIRRMRKVHQLARTAPAEMIER